MEDLAVLGSLREAYAKCHERFWRVFPDHEARRGPVSYGHGIRELDFGDSVTLSFGSPATDHPGHHDHTQGRGENEGHPLRSHTLEDPAPLIEKQPLHPGNHPSKPDRGDPGEQTDGGGEGQGSGSGGTAQLEAQAMEDLAVLDSLREAYAKDHERFWKVFPDHEAR